MSPNQALGYVLFIQSLTYSLVIFPLTYCLPIGAYIVKNIRHDRKVRDMQSTGTFGIINYERPR
jgi:hypothetical protein